VDGEDAPVRKLRADGQRNRERLLEAAKLSFGEVGPGASLDEIARRAGVGIGTLYRHFPTREALVEAVYRREFEQLAEAAPRLVQEMPAGDALQHWLHLAVDYIASKKVIAAALDGLVGGDAAIYAASGERITEAMYMLVERAIASGDIRADTQPKDVMRALIGFTYGHANEGWQASANRLIDIFLAGLRTPRA
jgi:AcrR family transcriptional regulator